MSELLINEIFHSIQGESSWVGKRCVFVRLRGCHLRCHYCDTTYAFHEGVKRTVDEIVDEVMGYECELVEITGGEPLLQKNVHELMGRLCDAGKTVLIETSGACDISVCDTRVIRIMDVKTPGSGEADRNLWSNMDDLAKRDEVKFVLCDRSDYDWAQGVMEKYCLGDRVNAVLMSAVTAIPAGDEISGISEGLSLRDLAEWVIADRLAVVVQTQLHKIIWDPMARGV